MPDRQSVRYRVAITGASGYLGRRLTVACAAAGHEVIALVRNPDEVRRWAPKGVDAREWSLSNTSAKHLQGVDVVCHLAAFIPPNMADPAFASQCMEDNALGTLRLLQAMREFGVSRMVHFSSGQLYRWQNRLVTEDDRLDPSERAPYYLGSKLLAEIFCRHAEAQGPMNLVILRVGSVYGSGMSESATIPRLIGDARNGRPIRLVAGGRYGADFVFADDVIAAAMAAIEPGVSGVFNVASGVRTTMAELARLILDQFGEGEPVVEPVPAELAVSPGYAALDVSRARAALGYTPTALAEGLRQTALG